MACDIFTTLDLSNQTSTFFLDFRTILYRELSISMSKNMKTRIEKNEKNV